MRITTSMAFTNMLGQVNRNLEEYRKLQNIISKEKKLNTPSDDPTGISIATNYHTQYSAYEQYLENMKEAKEFLTATDSALQKINDIITKARTVAEQNATSSANEQSRKIGADQVKQMINESIGLANTKIRDSYIFSGYKTNEPTYANTGRILPPFEKQNTYNGDVTSSGEFTGTENKSYIVKITTAGALGVAQYQVSEDGGTTWSNNKTMQSNIDVYDDVNGKDLGVNLSFTAGNFAVGDSFKVDVVEGKYNGDNGQIEYNSYKGSKITTNVTGKEVFEDSGFMNTMHRLEKGLADNNVQEISESLKELREIQVTLQSTSAKVGARLNRVEIAKNNLTSLKTNLTKSIQNVEKPDMFEAVSKLAMQENALNSSTTMLGKILPSSLLNYI